MANLKTYFIGEDDDGRPALHIIVPYNSAKDFLSNQISLAKSEDGWNGSQGFVHVIHAQKDTARSFFSK